MKGLLDDPQKLSMLLSGLGLLGSKTRNQADRWKAYGAQGLLSAARDKKAAEEKANDPLRQAQIANLGAETDRIINPIPPAPKWSLGNIGAEGDLMQKIAFNTTDPSQTINLGLPYTPAPQTLIDQSTTNQNEFTKQMAKDQAARLSEVVKATKDSEKMLNTISGMRNLLDQGFKPGLHNVFEKGLGKVQDVFGFEGDAAQYAAQSEEFDALSKSMSLAQKSGMTGNMSDKDIAFLEKQSAQSGATAGGVQKRLDYLEKIHERLTFKAQAMQDWAQENRSLNGFDKWWKDYINENEIFSDSGEKPKPGRVYNPETGEFE